ncbi:hypothetical protein ACXVUM_16455 [Williamsia sp. SKLECPSW1]
MLVTIVAGRAREAVRVGRGVHRLAGGVAGDADHTTHRMTMGTAPAAGPIMSISTGLAAVGLAFAVVVIWCLTSGDRGPGEDGAVSIGD